jgi:glucose-6-phosphate 1-epimerase
MVSIHKLSLASGDSIEVHDDGAHITSWRTADGIERLFLSQRSEFRPGVAIRGGVPIIFPQFAGLGSLPKHGFARTSAWQRIGVANESPGTALFRLQDSDATRAIWPQQFVADYAIALSRDSLRMTLTIRNSSQQAFSFTAALHTYLRVQDIDQVNIDGLQGLRYRDSAGGDAMVTEQAAAVRIGGEVDRIYFSTAKPITVNEPGQRNIVCSAEGFSDSVIWNPGAAKGATLSDLEPEGYRRMLCVEAAAIAEPVVLEAGAEWSGTQLLTLQQSSSSLLPLP